MALWARLGDGNRANKIFKGYLNEQSCSQLFALCGKAMQVDGSLGMTAAITEMLMQSHDGAINLLPALPAEWSSGELRGVRARGGFELDIKWAGGKVTDLSVISKAGAKFKMKSARPVTVVTHGKARKPNGTFLDYIKLSSPISSRHVNGVVEFSTFKDNAYTVKFN